MTEPSNLPEPADPGHDAGIDPPPDDDDTDVEDLESHDAVDRAEVFDEPEGKEMPATSDHPDDDPSGDPTGEGFPTSDPD